MDENQIEIRGLVSTFKCNLRWIFLFSVINLTLVGNVSFVSGEDGGQTCEKELNLTCIINLCLHNIREHRLLSEPKAYGSGREAILESLVTTMASSGLVDESMHILSELEVENDTSYVRKGILSIALAQIEKGQTKEAKMTIMRLQSPGFRMANFLSVAKALNNKGELSVANNFMNETLKATDKISSPTSRFHAFHLIAEAYSEFGDLKGAKKSLSEMVKITDSVNKSSDRAKLFRELAVIMGEMGYPQQSRIFFKKALVEAGKIHRGSTSYQAFQETVKALSNARMFKDPEFEALAFDIAERIRDGWKDAALSIVAGAQAEMGEIDKAIKTAEKIKRPFDRSFAWESIIETIAQEDDIETALKLVAKVDDKLIRNMTLESLVKVQVEKGNLKKAKEISERIHDLFGLQQIFSTAIKGKPAAGSGLDSYHKDESLASIIQAQVSSGKTETIFESIKMIKNPIPRIESYLLAGKAFMRTKDPENGKKAFREAIMTAEQWKDASSVDRDIAFKNIAIVIAETKNYKTALRLIRRIDDKEKSNSALSELARILTEDKKIKHAIFIGGKISDSLNRAKAYCKIAESFFIKNFNHTK